MKEIQYSNKKIYNCQAMAFPKQLCDRFCEKKLFVKKNNKYGRCLMLDSHSGEFCTIYSITFRFENVYTC